MRVLKIEVVREGEEEIPQHQSKRRYDPRYEEGWDHADPVVYRFPELIKVYAQYQDAADTRKIPQEVENWIYTKFSIWNPGLSLVRLKIRKLRLLNATNKPRNIIEYLYSMDADYKVV